MLNTAVQKLHDRLMLAHRNFPSLWDPSRSVCSGIGEGAKGCRGLPTDPLGAFAFYRDEKDKRDEFLIVAREPDLDPFVTSLRFYPDLMPAITWLGEPWSRHKRGAVSSVFDLEERPLRAIFGAETAARSFHGAAVLVKHLLG